MGEMEYSIHDFSIILEDSKVLSLPWTIKKVQEDYNVLQTKKLWKYLDKILETCGPGVWRSSKVIESWN